MKHYIVQTLMVALPEVSSPVLIELPDNVIPLGVEVRPAIMPQGLFLHHLIPCDEKGEALEEVISNVYETAWNELYKLFSERLEQGNVDAMDLVLKGLALETESEAEAKEEAGQET